MFLNVEKEAGLEPNLEMCEDGVKTICDFVCKNLDHKASGFGDRINYASVEFGPYKEDEEGNKKFDEKFDKRYREDIEVYSEVVKFLRKKPGKMSCCERDVNVDSYNVA